MVIGAGAAYWIGHRDSAGVQQQIVTRRAAHFVERAVAVIERGEHFHALLPRHDPGCANKDPRHRSDALYFNGRLETCGLAPVAVAANRHRQRAVAPLVRATVQHLRTQEDQPRARAKDRETAPELLAQDIT